MYKLYRHQEEMIEPMRARENVLLIAPCGSGKTLAAVNSWLKEKPTSHLLYVLPTQTLLKSIKNDVIKILENLGYENIKLENKSFSDNPQICIATDYGGERETMLYAHDIVFTTLDSYISRLYRCALTPRRYRDLPTARILNSTTVFDEAHMYDEYTHTLMRYTLKLLREGNAHHIVMSATLNVGMINYLELKDGYYSISVSPEKWMSFVGNKKIKELIEFKNKNEIGKKIKYIINKNDIKKAMIICNTVEKAQRVFEELNSINLNVLLLHSRFKSDDRDSQEKRISDIINNDDGFIIATQVVEAGLDISVPNLITEIAPGDSLVQRIGRCARRTEEHGNIYILYSKTEKVLPYSRAEIDPLLKTLQPTEYNYQLENILVNSVIPPQLSNEAEAKARGIILNAFTSLSAFGDAWINLPTRDSTPMYLYFGENISKDVNPLDSSVRVDIRFLYGFSDDLKGFAFYHSQYDKDSNKIKWTNKPETHYAWSIAVPKKGIEIRYDQILGVVKNE